MKSAYQERTESASRRRLSLLAVTLLVLTSQVLAQGLPQGGGAPLIPIHELLRDDGTVDLAGGREGGVDPSGFRMTTGADGSPRFAPEAASWRDEGGSWAGGFHLPGADGPVYAIAVGAGGDLYVGGDFTSIDGRVANRVARWDGAAWSAVGSRPNGVNGPVRALAVSGGDLYVGGDFRLRIGGTLARHVARWDGAAWHALGDGDANGVDREVRALAVAGSDLYVGGDLGEAGGIEARHVARWDGAAWHALGDGVETVGGFGSATVYALAHSGSGLYAGGRFTHAGGVAVNHIARWDGTAWSALGTGDANGVGDPESEYSGVSALAVSGSDVYAGGGFTEAGGAAANHIAKWDGTSWSALGEGAANGVGDYGVSALAVSGGGLYAGGTFTEAGGLAANYVARWDGTAWSTLEDGVSHGPYGSYVHALAVSGGDVYVGGEFSQAGGATANRVARWDGAAWTGVAARDANGVGGPIYALALSGGSLYAGGHFTEAGGAAANHVARWDGTAWSALGDGAANGVDSRVFALSVLGDDLYVGGTFREAGGLAARYVARWDGTSWSPLGEGEVNGVSGWVYALAVSGSDLYVGGDFSEAGGVAANNVALWDGTSWSALGDGAANGVDERVLALAAAGDAVYVGGRFTHAGGTAANRVARWDGSAWSALGDGTANGVGGSEYPGVFALAASGSELYVGGGFTRAGNVAANRVARWDGTAWSALGEGVSQGSYRSYVLALAVRGGDFYVGGDFGIAGGGPAEHIARWDGTSWSRFGLEGTDGWVYALAVSDTALYVGGLFRRAGNAASSHIARWDFAGPVSTEREAPPSTPFELAAAYPNPASRHVRVPFRLAHPASVSVAVYDVLGRRVAVLLDGEPRGRGWHEVGWEAEGLASGVYIVRLEVGDHRQSRRIMLTK